MPDHSSSQQVTNQHITVYGS